MKTMKVIEPARRKYSVSKARVAAYCRVSTSSDEQLLSLETQKTHYETLINANPEWTFAGLYYDSGISGTKADTRPELQRMISDCKDGKIDRILTKSLSRFARNTTDCLEIVRTLLGLGIPIYFEKENLDTGSMESELLLSVMGSLAEDESRSMSENSKWGIKRRFENGTFKASCAPYGYEVHDGVFTINEEEAKWVRWIFSEAINGKSTSAIAKELNDWGVPTSRGRGEWYSTTVRAILKNEKYIGDCLYQKTFTDFRFKRHLNHDDCGQYYMEDHHEPIVSREDFAAANALVDQRRKEKNQPKQTPGKYPFTRMLTCGECGTGFRRRTVHTGRLSYPIWCCPKHIQDTEVCSMKSVREDRLQSAFITMMNKLIFARTEILPVLAEDSSGGIHKDSLKKIDEIQQKLEKNDERQKTLAAIMVKGYLDPAVFARERNELLAEAEWLEKEKKEALRQARGDTHTAELLDDFCKLVGHSEIGSEFDGELLRRLIDHIIVHSQDEVTFCFKCGLNLRERLV